MRAAALGGKIYRSRRVGHAIAGRRAVPGPREGRADATEFSLPTVDDQLGFCRQILLPAGLSAVDQPVPLRELAAWNKLKPETQALIETTCTAGVTMAIAKAEALQGDALAKFERRATAVKVPDDLLKAFQKAVMEVVAEESAKDAMFKKVADSMTAFQAKNQKWHEYGYLPRNFVTLTTRCG